MAINFSAQNSITIRRLTNGHTFSMWFLFSGAHLYQSIDQDDNPSPSWGPLTGPEITPCIMAGSPNLEISISNHKWEYDGTEIVFDAGTSVANEVVVNGGSPRFRLNKTTGQLHIIANLASASAMTNKTLTYSCVATVDNVPYVLKKSVDVILRAAGTNGYSGYIHSNGAILSADKDSVTLEPVLYCGGEIVEEYTVVWFKGAKLLKRANRTAANPGLSFLDVSRANVDGCSTFVVEFHAKTDNPTPSTCLYKAGIQIQDITDEYQIEMSASQSFINDNTTTPVTVTATLKNATKPSATVPKANWRMQVVDPKDFSVLAAGTTNSATSATIEVTKANTEVKNSAGKIVSYRDVEVWAEATIG